MSEENEVRIQFYQAVTDASLMINEGYAKSMAKLISERNDAIVQLAEAKRLLEQLINWADLEGAFPECSKLKAQARAFLEVK